MRNLVSELAITFFSPIGVLMLSLAVAFFLRRRFAFGSRLALIVGHTVFFLFSLPAVSNILYGSLESQHPALPVANMPSADYIVVLGGGLSLPQPPRVELELGVSGDRVLYALRLYRAGKATAIIATGGARFKDNSDHSEAFYTRKLLSELGVPESSIFIEEASTNTAENAQFTKELITRQLQRTSTSADTASILLVTSSSHMPRAVSVFASTGLSVIPAATDVRVVGQRVHVWRDFLPDAVALARSSTACKEYLGVTVRVVVRTLASLTHPS